MVTFKKYLVNEMPVALKNAAVMGDTAKFKNELLQAYYKVKGSLESPGTAAYSFSGATDIKIHEGGEKGGKLWPYLTFKVATPSGVKEVEINVPDEGDITSITDFNFVVDGEQKSFATTTQQSQKRTGDISTGPSYMLSGLKQAIFGGKRAEARKFKKQSAIDQLSDEELQQILATRQAAKAGQEIPAEV